MRIYSASLLFWADKIVQHHPVTTNSFMYSSFETFLDFCSISVQQNPLFSVSDVHIYGMEVEQFEDGSLRRLQEKVIEYKNWRANF